MKDTVNGFLECPVVAIETRDEIFERIHETRLPDPESWKRFIQRSPADDRAYLRKLQEVCLENYDLFTHFLSTVAGTLKPCVDMDSSRRLPRMKSLT